MNTEAGKKLSEFREKRKIKQVQMAGMLARAMNQSYSLRQYQKLEQGIFPVHKTQVVKEIDKILGSNLYELIYEQNMSVNDPEEQYRTNPGELKGSSGVTVRDYIALLEKQISFLEGNVSLELTSIKTSQEMILAYEKAALDYRASLLGSGNTKKIDQARLQLNKLVADHLASMKGMDTHVPLDTLSKSLKKA